MRTCGCPAPRTLRGSTTAATSPLCLHSMVCGHRRDGLDSLWMMWRRLIHLLCSLFSIESFLPGGSPRWILTNNGGNGFENQNYLNVSFSVNTLFTEFACWLNCGVYLDGILFKRPAAVKQRKLQIRGVNSVNPDKDHLYSNNKSEEQATKRWTFFGTGWGGGSDAFLTNLIWFKAETSLKPAWLVQQRPARVDRRIFQCHFPHRVHSSLPGAHDRFHRVRVFRDRGHPLWDAVLQDRRGKLPSEGEDRCDWGRVLPTTR